MKQGNPTIGGQAVILNTTSSAVADPARSQALSASLTTLVEKNVLGYPTFSTLTAYAAGDTVFHDRRLYTFNVAHAAGAWDGSQVSEASIKDLILALVKAGLEAGDIIPALSENLANWEGRDALAIESAFDTLVRTTAGDESVNSDEPARLVSIVPATDFKADALRATGFNLLRNAPTVGTGFYMLLPKLEFGTFGNAEKVNGLLFTDKNGNNLTPTVRFKPLADGAPRSVSDGTACPYRDSNGLRFYTTPGIGYVIVSGITLNQTCAHLAWSRRYEEYVAVDDADDAGSTINLTDIIAACHDFGLLLVASRYGETVADDITFGDNAATWHRRVGRVQPSWTSTPVNDSEGNPTGQYLHETVIADMKAGGIVECGSLNLEVSSSTVSYTDSNAAATTDYVKYELATVATGNVAVAPMLEVEDWGLEVLTQATGSATVTVQYAQNYQDAIANMVNGGYQARVKELEAQIAALKESVKDLGSQAEGYVRIAGSSNPALSYKHYQLSEEGGFTRESAFDIFYPCLVGTKLTGDNNQVGKILYVLKKLGATTVEGVVKWEDLDGNLHAIDGSEGDLMVCNIQPYYHLSGRYTVDGLDLDVMLRSTKPFTWHGYEAELYEKNGVSPDYCVMHTDTDNVSRMHSVYNPDWNGSYTAPYGMTGKYIYSQDPQTGDITEAFDADATLLGGAGGLHTTNLALYDGEQRAMNQNPDTTKTVPFMNATARGAEMLWTGLAAEGGTFDAHKAALFGSGFSSNDAANAAAHWEEGALQARNGMRLVDKNGTTKYYGLNANMKTWTVGHTNDFWSGQLINDYRHPWHCNEAYRVLCYAVANGIGELQWFAFEGNKYKWRSVDGFRGPQQGEATAVVFKMMSANMTANILDPSDKETPLTGNRIDFLVSTALFHGVTLDVSPSWWTSGLTMTEDENGQYECYVERDQEKILKSANGDKDVTDAWPFENTYIHAGTFAKGEGYRKNYSNSAFMLPDSNTNKSGASLHTFIGAFNWFNGTEAPTGKKSVRGFGRGYRATYAVLSPMTLNGSGSPSGAASIIGCGTCVRITE